MSASCISFGGKRSKLGDECSQNKTNRSAAVLCFQLHTLEPENLVTSRRRRTNGNRIGASDGPTSIPISDLRSHLSKENDANTKRGCSTKKYGPTGAGALPDSPPSSSLDGQDE
ncbi:hypothetical protein RUM44_004954 [Polyplax serrata]|uniref:Uncharacterized protein n=1 Tax=Polyplax serrata TaxID=468196 RepID=A0ABR1AWW6_POLSC